MLGLWSKAWTDVIAPSFRPLPDEPTQHQSVAGARQTPRTVREIPNRLNEITFNSTLKRELRAVAFVQRLIGDGKFSPDEYKNVHLHRIDASDVLDDHDASSKSKAEWDYFVQLRDAGRRTAQTWLSANYAAIGQRGTFDLQGGLT